MKLRYLVSIFTSWALVLGHSHAVTNIETRELPDIVWDDTPLDRSNRGRMASYADMLDNVTPAVVSVATSKLLEGQRYQLPEQFQDDPFLKKFFGERDEEDDKPKSEGLGSGVIISSDGYVLTNNHVIENVDGVSVRLVDGRELEAEIIGVDAKTDVAVLKVNEGGLPFLIMADSDQARVGDIVFAVGNPLRVGQTVTQGIVSATNRNSLSLIDGDAYENFLQTDASINPGNSGGALVDAEGRVLGINTAILSQSGGSIGIGFAIPSNLAKNVMMDLIQTGEVRRGYLGVGIGDLNSDMAEEFGVVNAQGAVITQVFPDTPADEAGLLTYDVIIAIDGRPVVSQPDLRLKVSQITPGVEAMMTVIRDGKEIVLPVVLGNLNDALVSEDTTTETVVLLTGVSLSELSPELRDEFLVGQSVQGLLVTEVGENSPYAGDLKAGMVIMAINRTKIKTMGEAFEHITDGRNLLHIYFEGKENSLVVKKD
ncbi:Do family serine endopeptidase [Opitutia bacterium ISCC 51]|nr:Do family serine endopeptidase [Opitutae bacterium ISCC 51]QXD27771.1 Do family serine endopeptidase [Opitutae bacterium ISCC 52]